MWGSNNAGGGITEPFARSDEGAARSPSSAAVVPLREQLRAKLAGPDWTLAPTPLEAALYAAITQRVANGMHRLEARVRARIGYEHRDAEARAHAARQLPPDPSC